jgi:hypothetical protein
MGRYLFGGILLAIVLGALFGVRASNDWLEGRGQNARNAISANPAAASNLTPVEQAGQNVRRQGDEDPTAAGNTATNDGANGSGTAPTEEATTPDGANGSPAPSTNQDPIPALW